MCTAPRVLRWLRPLLGVMALGPFCASAQSNLSYSGWVRADIAVTTDSDEDPYNQRGNLFNGVPVERNSVAGVSDVAVRTGEPASNTLNLLQLRTQLDAKWRLTPSLDLVGKLAGVFDPALYDEFDPDVVDSQAVGRLYAAPDYFRYDVEGRTRPMPLEWSGDDGMVYLPEFYLSYSNGPFILSAGQQQIAWGQALFFRVLDVPNGLDLRRHSVLDYAPEEFQDKRVPSLALRAGYQFSEAWLIDAFVQKFQPTVYSNPNTPYNVIASQFTIHDRYGDYDDKLGYGLRVKGSFGDVGVQAIAVRRYNPDGVYRWTESGVNRDLAAAPGSGALMAGTPFEVDPTGVWSADEWFTYAAMARLNGVTGLNSAVSEFEAAQTLGAYEVDNRDNAAQELDYFFQASGSGLRGHLAREYVAETNLGAGFSYVTSAAPGSWLDQLIINVEALYVPDRAFTNPSLSREFLREDEWTTALVMEKYQRLSARFPASYFVLQWLHKTHSDLFGRHLSGMNGDVETPPPGESGGYDAVAFAVQQAFPDLIWRADLSVLYDLGGGILIQPALRWKPRGEITVEAFYNFVDGGLGGNPNGNALSTADFADELALRVGYQF
jgi:hypothetical protein